MAPLNSEIAEKLWSEQDRNKEIFLKFQMAAEKALKMKYEEKSDCSSDQDFRKSISNIVKNDFLVIFNSEDTINLNPVFLNLKPVFLEIVTLLPHMEDCAFQLVSTPIDEFGILDEEEMGFAKFFDVEDNLLSKDEKIEEIYSYLTCEDEDERPLCMKDCENYYFLLTPIFEEGSIGHEKIMYIQDLTRGSVSKREDEDEDGSEDTRYH